MTEHNINVWVVLKYSIRKNYALKSFFFYKYKYVGNTTV